ncbi:MAG: DNA adenine methylase [Vulcanimicrobiaceae bacterium]
MSRPILRYFGGKSKLAPWITSHFPTHHTYVEPFAGAASVLMQKERAQIEILVDRDDEIVNVHRVLRERPHELERVLRLTPYAETEFVRAFEQIDDDLERARRTIVKSMMGVGADSIHRKSGFRKYPHRRIGRYSQTICAHEWSTYPDKIERFAERLSGVQIECGDAIETMLRYDTPQTLVYADPPYVMSSRKTAGKRYRFEMTDDGHRELAAVLRNLQSMVIVSGYTSELYEELYEGWHVERRQFHADTEILWLNDAAHRALHNGLRQATIWDAVS